MPFLPPMSELAWNNGHSIAEVASRDLDAALQLLADRAQYVTGASGAAIALRGEHDDMLCRASSGSSAPQLGALLSTDHGLSGESVRTRQLQRCNNAQTDARVNREVCRRLGIASVLIMPIVSGNHVLGVFELFSGKAYAFNEPDVSALERLSAMVELAVKFAVTETSVPSVDAETATEAGTDAPAVQELSPIFPLPAEVLPQPEPQLPEIPRDKVEAAPASKRPLFWSAAAQARGSESAPEPTAPQTSVPPVLRKLQKCSSCGFPISSGRTLCVECEEKQWRGRK
ncbi:MAG TPA: GAF domain-containing protein [Candidatus Aquilonibacter sp.]|nr:GAF domain-containing protein [Candidatus Aquilonibacter sp.]